MRPGSLLFLLCNALLLPRAAWAQAAPPPFSPAVIAGNFVYLSGALPTDAPGTVVAGDIRVQTARALDNLSALLDQNGSRMSQVAAVTVYLKNQADFAAMNEVYARYWPKDAADAHDRRREPRRARRAARGEHGGAARRRRAEGGASRRRGRPPSNPYSYAHLSRATRCSSRASSRATARTTPPCPAT